MSHIVVVIEEGLITQVLSDTKETRVTVVDKDDLNEHLIDQGFDPNEVDWKRGVKEVSRSVPRFLGLEKVLNTTGTVDRVKFPHEVFKG